MIKCNRLWPIIFICDDKYSFRQIVYSDDLRSRVVMIVMTIRVARYEYQYRRGDTKAL